MKHIKPTVSYNFYSENYLADIDFSFIYYREYKRAAIKVFGVQGSSSINIRHEIDLDHRALSDDALQEKIMEMFDVVDDQIQKIGAEVNQVVTDCYLLENFSVQCLKETWPDLHWPESEQWLPA